jgi:NAD(P)H dehydrogenase (quinone)
MNISVILAHPDAGSFNHAIARTAVGRLKAGGHHVVYHDLYAENFNPVITAGEIAHDANLTVEIQIHCSEIANADGIVIVHPNWWGQPPAILKGWVDRVLRPGVAYRFLEGDNGEGIPVGLLKAKAVIVFNTANTTPERESSVFSDPLELLWKNCIFGLCGVSDFKREVFAVIVSSSHEQRLKWLKRVEQRIDMLFTEYKNQ